LSAELQSLPSPCVSESGASGSAGCRQG
jgi:hypothetical protein